MARVAPPPPHPGEPHGTYQRRVHAWEDEQSRITSGMFLAVLVSFLIFALIAFVAALAH